MRASMPAPETSLLKVARFDPAKALSAAVSRAYRPVDEVPADVFEAPKAAAHPDVFQELEDELNEDSEMAPAKEMAANAIVEKISGLYSKKSLTRLITTRKGDCVHIADDPNCSDAVNFAGFVALNAAIGGYSAEDYITSAVRWSLRNKKVYVGSVTVHATKPNGFADALAHYSSQADSMIKMIIYLSGSTVADHLVWGVPLDMLPQPQGHHDGVKYIFQVMPTVYFDKPADFMSAIARAIKPFISVNYGRMKLKNLLFASVQLFGILVVGCPAAVDGKYYVTRARQAMQQLLESPIFTHLLYEPENKFSQRAEDGSMVDESAGLKKYYGVVAEFKWMISSFVSLLTLALADANDDMVRIVKDSQCCCLEVEDVRMVFLMAVGLQGSTGAIPNCFNGFCKLNSNLISKISLAFAGNSVANSAASVLPLIMTFERFSGYKEAGRVEELKLATEEVPVVGAA